MSKFTDWFAGLFGNTPPDKYDIEALRIGAAKYVTEKYSLPKEHKKDEKPVQYSAREDSVGYGVDGKDGKKPAQYSEREPYPGQTAKKSRRQYQTHGYDPDIFDPIPSLLHSELNPNETRALGILLDKKKGKSFTDTLLALISEKGVRDSYVYKRAQIDRRLFSKIAGDRSYKPSKDTVLAFALAMKCSVEEAGTLLASAGYLLSKSSKRDIIIDYFFREGIYDLGVANTILDQLGEKIIGRANVG